MTNMNNVSKSLPNNPRSNSQLIIPKSSLSSSTSNPLPKFSRNNSTTSISTTLFDNNQRKRNFFDSPRSSFSKSYSASALRISRTSSDYDERRFNDFKAIESSDEENNKHNSDVDDSSSSDDNDINIRNEKSNEIFKKNLACSSTSSISKLSSFKFSNFKVNNASNSIKNIFSLKSVENSPSSSTPASPKSPIPSNNFNFEMHHLSPKTTSINQNNEITPSTVLNNNNSNSNNSNKIEFFRLTSNSNSSPGSNSNSNSNIKSKGPNIFFKKIVSKKALTPKLKAFKRVANELQIEMSPIDDELKNEMVITSAIKDEDEILNSHGASNLLLSRKHNPYLLNQDNLKKFEIINKANESWNHNRDNKKSISSFNSDKTIKSNSISRRGSSNFLSNKSHLNQNQNNNSNNLKRKNNYDNNEIVEDVFYNDSEFLHYIHPSNINNSITQNDDLEIEIDNQNNKRRLVCVTNSPILGATAVFATTAAPGSRRSSTMLIQSTSDDLEMMSLR